MPRDDIISIKYKATLPVKKKKKAVSLKSERENIVFQTNGKVAATVNVTIKGTDNLRTR